MKKTDLTKFDHQRVADLDAAMWRSYYNHQFFRLFLQLVQLVKSQLGFGWFTSLGLAVYAAWAATEYRLNKKKGNVNASRIESNLVKFYKRISDNSLQPFDYLAVAKHEFEWWEIHRKSYQTSSELELSLAQASAAAYCVDPAQLSKYAHLRAEAMMLPRHVGDRHHDTDWDAIQSMLRKAWKSLHHNVQNNK